MLNSKMLKVKYLNANLSNYNIKTKFENSMFKPTAFQRKWKNSLKKW